MWTTPLPDAAAGRPSRRDATCGQLCGSKSSSTSPKHRWKRSRNRRYILATERRLMLKDGGCILEPPGRRHKPRLGPRTSRPPVEHYGGRKRRTIRWRRCAKRVCEGSRLGIRTKRAFFTASCPHARSLCTWWVSGAGGGEAELRRHMT
jgi:hypothetical protein